MGQPDEMPGGLPPEMVAHYSQGVESGRLFRRRSQLERVRTQELLRRHLPPPPAVVLDVGGGPGVYACWLAGLGYEVHLIDAVPLHVEQAKRASSESPERRLASVRLGDARRLEQLADTADAVLLLGPLYHLVERTDRLQALREAGRVVRAGGLVFAVGITRFASLLDGLSSGFLDDPAFQDIVEEDLRSGQHRNPTNHPDYFTTAFFHHPDELRDEVSESGLEAIEMVGIEGPAYWAVRDFPAWWDDPARRERMIEAARAVEREPSLMGMGPHVMVVARKRKGQQG